MSDKKDEANAEDVSVQKTDLLELAKDWRSRSRKEAARARRGGEITQRCMGKSDAYYSCAVELEQLSSNT